MNKYYVIVPAVLLLAFVGFERDFQEKREAEERVRAEIAAATKFAEEEERQKQQLAAQQDAQKRAADRERQERERAEKKRADYEAMMAALQKQADEQTAEAAKLAAELEQLTTLVTEMRAKRQAVDHETFELARNVELQRVDRRTAELEIQRTTSMVAARLGESGWANPMPRVPLTGGK